MKRRRFQIVTFALGVVVFFIFAWLLSPPPGTQNATLTNTVPAKQSDPVSIAVSPIETLAPATPSPSPQPSPTTADSTSTRLEESARAAGTFTPERDQIFDTLLKPFVAEAFKRREERSKREGDYFKRINKQLNENRINFLLFGYGESHEPPYSEKITIGSHTIASYNILTRQVDFISFTHDIRAPSIEAAGPVPDGKRVYAQKIDQAYRVGGFRLMRTVMENATGLSMDFQIAFKDVIIQRVIDELFQGIEVDVPVDFDVHPFYLDGKKYDKGHFSKGTQKLSGTQAIQFIKTVPMSQGYYGKPLEHNQRKYVIFRGLLETLSKRGSDRTFWLHSSAFLTRELVTGAIAYDFDPVSLAINNLGTVPEVGKYVAGQRASKLALPAIRRTIYVADPANGDGGVQWVGANAVVNPVTRRDINDGKYLTLDMTIPLNANPDGDLITSYWPSVRNLVLDQLADNEP